MLRKVGPKAANKPDGRKNVTTLISSHIISSQFLSINETHKKDIFFRKQYKIHAHGLTNTLSQNDSIVGSIRLEFVSKIDSGY